MVVLGGWYLYQCNTAVNTNPRLCKALAMSEGQVAVEVWWADIDGWGYANEKHLTPLPEELNPILSDSIKTGE